MNSILILSPARLHFGLIEIATGQSQRFGGVGVTVSEPAARLRLSASDHWQIVDHSPNSSASDRRKSAQKAANRWCESRLIERLPPIQMTIESAAPRHFGLGSGTQLAACVVTLLEYWHQFKWQISSPKPTLELWQSATRNLDSAISKQPEHLLAELSGRGNRSFIGLTSFLRGGWIVDHGLNHHDCHQRTEVYPPKNTPTIVLILPKGEPTVAGQIEVSIFEQLQQQSNARKEEMNSLLFNNIAPFLKKLSSHSTSLSLEQLNHFDNSVFEYGRLAGLIFAPSQGGEYATPIISERVATLRQSGIRGVGQSSWGPGIFCFCWTSDQLNRVREIGHHDHRFENCIFTETTVATQGATITTANQTA